MREKPGIESEVMYVPLRTRRTLIFLPASHFCACNVSPHVVEASVTYGGSCRHTFRHDPAMLELRYRPQVIHQQHHLVPAVELERHKCPVLVRRVCDLAEHLVHELGDRRKLVLARARLVVDAHAQLVLTRAEMRVVRGRTRHVAVIESDADRAQARVDVVRERLARVKRAAS